MPCPFGHFQISDKIRKELNEKDNAESALATDVLMNYDNVVLFNNQELEMTRYHRTLKEKRVCAACILSLYWQLLCYLNLRPSCQLLCHW